MISARALLAQMRVTLADGRLEARHPQGDVMIWVDGVPTRKAIWCENSLQLTELDPLSDDSELCPKCFVRHTMLAIAGTCASLDTMVHEFEHPPAQH